MKIPKRFQLLNTRPSDNKLYYGTAYGSGTVNITGPLSNVNMDLQLRSEKGTVFVLPIGANNVYTGHDEIHFISRKDTSPIKKPVNISGLSMYFSLELTSDAKLKLLLDGDLLEASGNGDMKLDFTPDGPFEMSGLYTINSGTYNFTLKNFYQRHFKIGYGSSITWRGSPYDALINLKAFLEVKTSLSPHLVNRPEAGTAPNQAVPVDVEMYLSGQLFKPNIKLDFEIPALSDYFNTNSSTLYDLENAIKNIKLDTQQINTQVAMLLTLGTFIPPNQGGIASGANVNSSQVFTNVSGLISGEANNYLSSFNASLNVVYSGGQAFNVDASKAFLNDRVNVSGNYGQNAGLASAAGPTSTSTPNTATNYNVEVSYKANPQSNFRYKIFNRYNNDNQINQSSNTFGFGFTFSKEFDKIRELKLFRFFLGDKNKNSDKPKK